MYLVLYTMIATIDHSCVNLNNVYMTLMMVAPMAIVMLFAMRSFVWLTLLTWSLALASAVVNACVLSLAGRTADGSARSLYNKAATHAATSTRRLFISA